MDLAAVMQSLDVTRALIEAEVNVPGVVAVTSAARGDGKSLIATSLASGLAGVGHNVLLVDADVDAAGPVPKPVPKLGIVPVDVMQHVVTGGRLEPARLSLAEPGALPARSLEAVQAMLTRLRENFAYVVLDLGVLVESGAAVALAGESDGVVIALKRGRAVLAADREVVKVLKAAKTPILGIVTAQSQTIRVFNARAVPAGPLGTRVRGADDNGKAAGGSLSVRVG